MGNLIFKYSSISFLVLLALVGGSLWAFGDKTQLVTERPVTPVSVLRTEELSSIGSTEGQQTLTQAIADQITQQIISKNPEGPEVGKGLLASDPAIVIEEAIAAELANVSADKLRPVVDRSKLTILPTTSKALATTYLTDATAVVKKNLGNLRVRTDELFATDFPAFLEGLDATVEALYKLPVPSDLVAFHIQEIEIFGEQRNIFSAIQNFKVDPIAGYIALQETKVLQKENMELQEWLMNYIEDNEIVF